MAIVGILMINKLFGDKEFYRTLFRLALPMAFQNLIASALNMVDTVMVGQLGETEIAAVGLANQFFFLLNLFLFGVCSGTAIFTAQFWGVKDIRNIRRVLGLSLILGMSVAFLFTLMAVVFPEKVLGIFSKDAEVIRLGSQYLETVAFSYIMTAVTFSYAFVLRSTGHVKVPMVLSIIAILINTSLNYILIFGKLGLPMLGVRGAAAATVIARAIEVLLILVIVYTCKYAPAARIKEMLDLSMDFVKKFLHTALPVIFNETLWALGMIMYSVVYARMGTDVIAAANIASTVERVAMVLFLGMGNACAVMVGNRIGAGDEKSAFEYAGRMTVLGPAIGMLAGIILMLSSGRILSIFNISADVHTSARRMLLIIGILMFVRVFNFIMIVGVFRSGGDTRFSLIMDTACVWFIAVPLAFVGGLVWKLPIHWVYLMVSMEEVLKFFIGLRRFISKKWINNLVVRMQA